MKNSILELILFDSGLDEKINMGEEYKDLAQEALSAYYKIKEQLTKEMDELFEKFVDSNLEETSLAEEAFFKEGFKAGFKIAVECLTD